MFRVDDALLDACRLPPESRDGEACARLSGRLGGLAGWLLHDDVLRRAAEHWSGRPHLREAAESLRQAPELPRGAGACWVACVVERPQEYPTLREAFLLPLLWRRAGRHGGPPGRLPKPLGELARSVSELMHAYGTGGPKSTPDDWELVAAVDAEPWKYDLSGLTDCDFDSGWAALAAGWLLAVRGGLPDTRVAATAAWRPTEGLEPVRHVRRKAVGCRRHGVRTLFVTDRQPETENLALEWEVLPSHRRHPLESLRPLLRRLAVPPGEDSPLADQSAYYWLLRQALGDHAAARVRYERHMLPQIATACRRRLEEGHNGPIGECQLVTLVSHSDELVELNAAVLRPRECLLLYTERTEPAVARARQRVMAAVPGIGIARPVCVPDLADGGLDEVLADPAIHEFAGTAPDRTVIDVTAGTKAMTVALTVFAQQVGAWLYVLQSEQAAPMEVRHGSERPLLFSAKAGPPPR